ncbi:MAG: carboxypeptidase regulatory-like domain-containing protein [Candidatus Aminicenantes bacterium]|nr:carboxypeptidase regulatory-like domain-containing protein [Candidatus Aminicenantes bacterium]
MQVHPRTPSRKPTVPKARGVVKIQGIGKLRVLSLEPGFYQASFEKEGYQAFVTSGIQLSADQSATLHIKLKKATDPDPPPSGD